MQQDKMNIQWYPGHMTKTRRQIEADLKQVDAVCEIVDARIPISSRNPDIDSICGNKPRIVILNRMDLADPVSTKLWVNYFKSKGIAAVPTDCKSRKGIGDFLPAVRSVLKEKIERDLARGMKRPLRVMIVGIPNVGKSTILSVTTGAKPEIADYHFTTIKPNLGIVFNNGERSFCLADIPGLIEGASEGQGLGHEFLRHIERTRLLIHVIDISGREGRDPFEDFLLINKELEQYNIDLAKRPQIIALNKMDGENAADNAGIFRQKFDKWLDARGEEIMTERENGAWRIFELSAITAQGTRELMAYCGSILDKMPLGSVFVAEDAETVYSLDGEEEPFTVRVEEGVYVVEGPWIKNIVDSVNLDDYESSQYFQRVIKKKGLIRKLEEMGIKENDTVRIYEIEFDYYV